MIALKPSHYLLFACGSLTLLILLSLHSHSEPHLKPSQWSLRSQPSSPRAHQSNGSSRRKEIDATSEIGRASNATLGFEKVFVLGLKERSDKRDAIMLAASLTGFQVEFFDALKGDDILDKALPPGMHLKGGELGCWRSHFDIIRSVVEKNLASAFILEDDADWDIRLLSQLPDFARGVRSLSNISISEPQHSPYGDDWDILWPGHCGDVLPINDDRRYIIQNDETVAPKAHQPWLMGLAEMPEYTRMVHRAGAPICTFGYAISYRGAEKLLMALAVKGGDSLPIDNSMAFLCRDGYLDIQCYSVEPQLFHHHRPAGSAIKDSDINGGDATVIREKGFTEMIVLSARLNLEQLIMGTKEYVKQW